MMLHVVPMNAVSNDCRPVPPQILPFPPPVEDLSQTALFLDFDGTLVDIAQHPDAISVAPGLPALLTRLNEQLEGKLAIVSGRSLADLEKHIETPNITMAGSHGGEIRLRGESAVSSLAAPIPAGVVSGLQEISEAHGGLLVEAKPSSAAIHYRDRPSAGDAVLARATALAEEAGLAVKHGKMVVELAMPGSDKGSAVSHFLSLPGFAGARPVFIGDDTTDEDAFTAVDLHGGHGILVGPARETAAQYRLPGVCDVHVWLKDLLS